MSLSPGMSRLVQSNAIAYDANFHKVYILRKVYLGEMKLLKRIVCTLPRGCRVKSLRTKLTSLDVNSVDDDNHVQLTRALYKQCDIGLNGVYTQFEMRQQCLRDLIYTGCSTGQTALTEAYTAKIVAS